MFPGIPLGYEVGGGLRAGSKNTDMFSVTSLGTGSLIDGRRQGILLRRRIVESEASPWDFFRAYNRRGPPIALTKKAISRSPSENPPQGEYNPLIARSMRTMIARALQPCFKDPAIKRRMPAIS